MARLDMETGLKICTRCLIGKPADDYNYCERGADKLQPWCRDCYKKYDQENRAASLIRHMEWRHNNQERMLYNGCRKRANQKCLPCTITIADIKIPDNCPVCDQLIERRNIIASGASPSVDMYDVTLGYVPGNMWVICRTCNRRKSDMSGEELPAFAFKVIDAFKEYNHD